MFNFLVMTKRRKLTFQSSYTSFGRRLRTCWHNRLPFKRLHPPEPKLRPRHYWRLRDRGTFRQEKTWIGMEETPNKPSDSGKLLHTVRPNRSQFYSSLWSGRRACICPLIYWGTGWGQWGIRWGFGLSWRKHGTSSPVLQISGRGWLRFSLSDQIAEELAGSYYEGALLKVEPHVVFSDESECFLKMLYMLIVENQEIKKMLSKSKFVFLPSRNLTTVAKTIRVVIHKERCDRSFSVSI